MNLTLSEESITTGLNVLAFNAIMVFVPFGPGKTIGSLLELGGELENVVVFETNKGETTPAMVLLSITNVTVCGSPTSVGLYQFTACPTFTSTLSGA